MIQRLLLTFLLLIFFSSCNFMDGFFKKEVKRIDFNMVDEYPIFPNCDSLLTEEEKIACFERTLSEQIESDLTIYEFNPPITISEALIIHVRVDRYGVLSFQEIEAASASKQINPELIDVIKNSIATLPSAKPAKKRGNDVGSVYMIPLYIE